MGGLDRPAAVLLVSMPWASTRRPNLGLSTLAAEVTRAGFGCEVLYPCIDFAAAIGRDAYETLADAPGLFAACEHVFARLLFDAAAIDSDAFLRHYTTSGGDNPFQEIFDLHARPFVDRTVAGILDREPAVVGFGCTFNQTLASLAVARELKAIRPALRIIFGGSSVHGPMGEALAQAFPDCLDHAFLGEADRTLPEWLASVRDAVDCDGIPGITVQGSATAPEPAMVRLDDTAVPDFHDYFDELARSGFERLALDGVPFESSRGCWWGQKHHCTFCGLNNADMTYRTKSPERIVREVIHLSTEYRTTDLMAADNILSHGSWQNVLPSLAGLGLDLNIFYEIKANLGRDQVGMLARAGVRCVQPGIESFSTRVLQLMRKGLTALQNVRFIRLCREFDLTASYNILVGFPGETETDCLEMASLIRRIAHLPPPGGLASMVQVHRFSPFYDNGDALGIGECRPAWSYRHLIPPAVLEPSRYAYFFDRPQAGAEFGEHLGIVNAAVQAWFDSDRRVHARLGPGYLEVRDSLHGTYALSPAESAVMLEADQPRPRLRLLEVVRDCEGSQPADACAVLDGLLSRDWLIADGDQLVSSVPFGRPHSQAELEGWRDRWLDARVEHRHAAAL